ncbi:MAG TPA: 2-amino-4-hydroxy-6-hydroxymethyldihydropteridine diphosphokinase [Blastocatellia bacterium]|nr:2-amino-4-hydroxy-6-hydroxymethyldihydropteridine diphosphokinase [Blastocatellia bacterium]
MTNGSLSKKSDIALYLGLGSNVGDREKNLREAIARIGKLGLEISRQSSIYETEPVGFTDQPWFLNQVIEAKFLDGLTSEHGPLVGDPEAFAASQAEALLDRLLNIEREMGRERAVVNGPRLIDIDLLLYGDKIIAHSKHDRERPVIDGTDVFVPHPRMHMRRFVLEPLCEIAPELVHPILRKTCRELLAEINDGSKVAIYKRM